MNYIDENLIYTIESNEIINYYKSLQDEEKVKYLKLYSGYCNFLIQFFIKKYNLKEYDDMLSNNSMNFSMVEKEKMDIYQLCSSKWLKYIYIRNNIHIERLSLNEVQFLEKQLISKNYELDKETEKFIEDTFFRIIIEKNSDQMISFGPNNLKFYKPANSIIIGIRYDNLFIGDSELEKEWLIKDNDRKRFLFALKSVLEFNLKKELSIPVTVIEYNDFSVSKNQM